MNRLNVLVYNGSGVSETSLKHTLFSLDKCVSKSHDIKLVSPNDLLGPWESTCSLFVMPGGRDLPYLSALGDAIILRIKNFIQEGGSYLGICAGAYFASRKIEFEKGRIDYEIVQDRPLGLFPGTARGSVYPNFTYGTEAGACAAKLIAEIPEKTIVNCYFNGGCQFDLEEHGENWNIVGRYSLNGEPAIVTFLFGKGRVLLSGVHPEYDPALFDHTMPANVSQLLALDSDKRLGLWRYMLSLLLPLFESWQGSESDMPISCMVGIASQFENKNANYEELFNSNLYVKSLKTQILGQTLLYTPRIGSTQLFFQEDENITALLPDGCTLLADEQTRGRGRVANRWISPPMKKSLQFTVTMNCHKVEGLSMLQCVVATAMVTAARRLGNTGSIFVKWPNDIYIRNESQELKKVGGILVNTMIFGDMLHVLVGCGINVNKNEGLASLQDVIGEKIFPRETLLAEFFNEFEYMWCEQLEKEPELVIQKYLDVWLHGGQRIYIESEMIFATIQGIDRYGYLIAEDDNRTQIYLQPDGNSFDMFSNLIKVKLTGDK